MKVIVPCAGRSSRYPNMAPKWSLPAADGKPMLVHAVSCLEIEPRDLIVTILEDHDRQLDARNGIKRAFGREVEVVILKNPTRSAPETIAETLHRVSVNEPVLVKDSDNAFRLAPLARGFNYVTVASLKAEGVADPSNKSTLQADRDGIVRAIREKETISDLFCTGGYCFLEPQSFLEAFGALARETAERELYVSDVVAKMIAAGSQFRAAHVTDYADWGTVEEWRAALLKKNLPIVLLDGVVFERGSLFFAPRFEETKPYPRAVEALRKLAANGNRILFLSIRPKSLAAFTEGQLKSQGLPANDVIYDCPLARYDLIAAPHPTLPFATARAREMAADDARLFDVLTRG
jgi:hypothetical protein